MRFTSAGSLTEFDSPLRFEREFEAHHEIMGHVMRILYALFAACFLGNQAHAGWFVDYDGQVALSEDGSISFSCPPPDISFMGPTFEVFTNIALASDSNPQVVFHFEPHGSVQWTWTRIAHIFAGPVENPYGEMTEDLYAINSGFDASAEELGYWRKLVDLFKANDTVLITVNGISLEQVSLAGSSRALNQIRSQHPRC